MAAQHIPYEYGYEYGEGSMTKFITSEVAVRTTEQAIQVAGGWGCVHDLPVEKWYRDAKLYTIFEGTSEIQRIVIGRGSPARSRAGISLLRLAGGERPRFRRIPIITSAAGGRS